MTKLQSLSAFNAVQRVEPVYTNEPTKNGIVCPKCGEEMFDTNPNIVLTSNPPQKDIHCECGEKTYRIC